MPPPSRTQIQVAHVFGFAAVAIGVDGADPAETGLDVPLNAGELPMVREILTHVVPAVEPGEGLA